MGLGRHWGRPELTPNTSPLRKSEVGIRRLQPQLQLNYAYREARWFLSAKPAGFNHARV